MLLDRDGKVLDAGFASGQAVSIQKALNEVRQWTFEPARFGNVKVPWYLDVEVPLDSAAETTETTQGGL